MLDTLGLALHGCLRLGPGLVLLLVAWATLRCCRSTSGKRHQVCAGSRSRGRRRKVHETDAEARAHGCGSSPIWIGSRPLGQLLCYDLDCERCSQAVRERQQRLLARQARASCYPRSSSSSDASDSSQHRAPARSFRPAKLTSVRSWWQPVLRNRKRRRPFPQRAAMPQTALKIYGATTLPCDAGPLRQAEELAKMAPRHHEAGLPLATGSDAADKDGNLPAGVDPRPMKRLEPGLGFWKLLRMHTLRKSIEMKLGALPTMVQQSHRRYTYRMARCTAPTPLHSRPAPSYFCSAEALFLPEDVREFLEMHIREKKLRHQWGLPAGSLGGPQALPSVP
ncbi:uncharacterized protein LOC121071511 isoform X3 [Cygnus olor]|uniref:uncharacterized protein LOC121071434 isoform X3 n=1 Tax=Cygnus olor TaxID=8869 RepID=UPI001ADDE9B1|nr:uncharacterized protein LOC121071434 isoform X3 [Cygnus olor]XP_040415740.1 uncharacterized protein LOC121071511 isoform X3 [Cygnus olor]